MTANNTNGGTGGGVRVVQIDDERAGQRLDNFLLGQLKGAPRSLIYRILRTGQVRVNGGRAKADQRLSAGDSVRIPPVRLTESRDDAPGPSPKQIATIEKAIVFEDDWLLALAKPSGIAAHGGSGVRFGAIELIRAARPNASLELVHRLDRDTSGLLLIAKKRTALLQLQALMRDGGITKQYLALLVGRLKGDSFTVDLPLERGKQGGERMVRVGDDGKDSVSHFKVLERRGGHSYVEVRIDTGRTHQIRVHAAHLGHPVAGDDKYGDREANRRLREKAGLKRLFLHAASLEFALDEGRRPYLLNAPLPDDLSDALNRLG
ncbi:MAG: RluA family pseudouridine synthase [Rhodanobacteraceae bacterium]|nr:RluA family pseudouridine synthase [Xanthomonadales bacterium]MCP5479717.1 RluA family pseudouridine synthase [Rhodanobacteraceae bacterium]HPF73887.1 RluA family pseudouridine synthase [Xanthomonadaceae bacterium]HRX98502.1 RluA family pseudouridine synthase [Xanthomonadaceae bacterium]